MLLLIMLTVMAAAAAFVVYYFITRDVGEKEPKRALIFVPLGFGILAIIIASTLEFFLPAGDPTTYADRHISLLIVLLSALLVGLIEETSKFLPAALFLRKKKYFNEYTDGIIYFAFIGLVFGLIEDFSYVLDGSGGVGVALGRMLTGLYFHASLAALVGFYFAKAKLQHRKYTSVIPVLLMAAGIHAIYDFGMFTESAWLILLSFLIGIGLNVALFVLFRRAKALDAKPTTPVLAIPAIVNCPKCGQPNTSAHYCVYCGNKL